jgi:hypothetical protein
VTCGYSRCHAAREYSLIRPPRMGFRRIRPRSRLATLGWPPGRACFPVRSRRCPGPGTGRRQPGRSVALASACPDMVPVGRADGQGLRPRSPGGVRGIQGRASLVLYDVSTWPGVRSATGTSWPLCTGSGSPNRLLSRPLVLRPRCGRGRAAGWLAPVGMEFGGEPVTVGVIDLAEYAQRLRPCPVSGGGVT